MIVLRRESFSVSSGDQRSNCSTAELTSPFSLFFLHCPHQPPPLPKTWSLAVPRSQLQTTHTLHTSWNINVWVSAAFTSRSWVIGFIMNKYLFGFLMSYVSCQTIFSGCTWGCRIRNPAPFWFRSDFFFFFWGKGIKILPQQSDVKAVVKERKSPS